MKDINGDELFNNDQVLINTKKGQSLEKIIMENDRYFSIGVCKTLLTEEIIKNLLTKEIIKNFQITKWKND